MLQQKEDGSSLVVPLYQHLGHFYKLSLLLFLQRKFVEVFQDGS